MAVEEIIIERSRNEVQNPAGESFSVDSNGTYLTRPHQDVIK